MNRSIESWEKLLQEVGIEQIGLMLPDVNGCARGKLLPVSKFRNCLKDGIAFARSVIAQDIEGENSPVPGFDAASGDQDLLGLPILETLHICPWQAGRADMLLESAGKDGVPLPQSSRSVLQKVLDEYQKENIEIRAAIELEFYLFRPDGSVLSPGCPGYSLIELERFRPVLDDLLRGTTAVGLELEGCLHEYAPGQLEINFCPADSMTMADRSFMFRQMVKETALRHGLDATFMAKPLEDRSGSGCHLHLSLWQEDVNLFWEPELADSNRPGLTLSHFIRGQQRYTNDLFSLYLPNVNSYRRHLGEYVPAGASWGGDDRTVAIRLPHPGPRSARIEHRIAGADVNPYLLLAGVLASGLQGIRDGGGLLEESGRGQIDALFPHGLAKSLNLLGGSEFAKKWFSPEFLELFLTVKQQELGKFQRIITEWERTRIGRAL